MALALIIGFAGMLGVLTRHFLAQVIPPPASGFPLSTFAINVIGSIVIAWIYISSTEKNWISSQLSQTLQIGLLGGFTTFSAYSLESWKLIQAGEYAIATAYGLGSPVACLLGVCLGAWLARIA